MCGEFACQIYRFKCACLVLLEINNIWWKLSIEFVRDGNPKRNTGGGFCPVHLMIVRS